MHSENGVLIDFDEVSKLVADADVFVVGFANFPDRLLVDARSNAQESPLVQVVEPATGPQQRLAWLRRRRPSLGSPEAFSFFSWPHSPAFLIQSGIWERIRRRVGADYDANLSVQCGLALHQLENLDRQAMYAVLRGENCATLWPPEPES
jgi:hypothetical protein